MANRILRVIFKKIHVDGSIDTIFFKSRAKDVMANDDGSKTLADIVNKVDNVKEGATKTEASSTNGQLLIDGKETTVYKHPNSGVTAGTYNKVTVNAEGHVTGASNVTDWTGSVSGDGSNETSTFTEATTRENLKTGEKHSTMFGKISKWFADLKPLAFVEKVGTSNLDTTLTTFYNNRVTTDKVTTSTSITEAGWVADARAIASLKNSIDSINSNLNNLSSRCTARYKYNEWRQLNVTAQTNTPVTTFELTEPGFYLIDVSVEMEGNTTSLSSSKVALKIMQDPNINDPIFMTEVFPPLSFGCRLSGYASWWIGSSATFSIRIDCNYPRKCTHALLRITKIF